MARPRKRRRESLGAGLEGQPPAKKGGTHPHRPTEKAAPEHAQHSVLNQFHSRVLTLREYVLEGLPAASRLRRKKVAGVGVVGKAPGLPVSDVERSLGALLDSTLVGIPEALQPVGDGRLALWKSFSQQGDDSHVTLSSGVPGCVETQAHLIDYVVKTLFSGAKANTWPKHLLCDGYRRNCGFGLRVVRTNPHVEMLKAPPWPQLLALMGDSGERIMIDLLLDCAVFVPLKAGTNNFCQISGKPLTDVKMHPLEKVEERPLGDMKKPPSAVIFIRSRMLYAKAALNARGFVHFGLRHIHVLNRSPYVCPDEEGEQSAESSKLMAAQNDAHTLRVMMYIFPRQFGLHNAFTSKVNFKETSQQLKDYTLREEEILGKFGRLNDPDTRVHVPKRLRGAATELVRKLQILHQRCSYSELFQHYCPLHESLDYREVELTEASGAGKANGSVNAQRRKIALQLRGPSSLPRKPVSSVFGLATPLASVSSFCRSVLKNIVPRGFWGTGSAAADHESRFLKQVDHFIALRRFEGMSLHEVMQEMKVTEIDWLAPPCLRSNKTSRTDLGKRRELFAEFLYFLFDSLLIPLIRSNFYVTESNNHKSRLFFFRHDVWRYVAEPAMATLKSNMFSEVSLAHAREILGSRTLGFSQVRLLPKQVGMRPVMNLRRRTAMLGNPKELGPSINKILTPAHTILQLEKAINPGRLGSALFDIGDIYERIKSFKARINTLGVKKLYFAKLDVQSAFDTIPQAAIVGLLESILQQTQYRVSTYAEVGPDRARQIADLSKTKPTKKWPSVATSGGDGSTLLQLLDAGHAATKRNTVFVDCWKKHYETSEVLQLVASHIQQNLVKIGKKFYRQKQGIPQGSVLSSTLCNYFYADLEARVLSFLDSEDCLLLRLIDDFLLISTDEPKVARFVQTMHQGVPEYGVAVSPRKTLVNFDLRVGGEHIARLEPGQGFPYCGASIDCETLDMSRSQEKKAGTGIYDSLTVSFSRTPGQLFQRRILNAFRIQSQLMFSDSELNSAKTTLTNLYHAFSGTATKMWAYARCLPPSKQPPAALAIRTISDLVAVAYQMLVSKTRKARHPGYACDIKRLEICWLVYNAFHAVLARKQSNYGETLAWLGVQIGKLRLRKDIRHGRVVQLVAGGCI